MDFNLKVGQSAKVERLVSEKDTAKAFGSGDVHVFATPMMIGIMENAALKAVDSFLPDGYATVGIHLDVKHLAATPVGMKVWAEAELLKVEGKKLTFSIKAYDELELIGEGTHERYIIPFEKFVQGAENKGK
jgi:predicted thioesterase